MLLIQIFVSILCTKVKYMTQLHIYKSYFFQFCAQIWHKIQIKKLSMQMRHTKIARACRLAHYFCTKIFYLYCTCHMYAKLNTGIFIILHVYLSNNVDFSIVGTLDIFVIKFFHISFLLKEMNILELLIEWIF